ncbi:MAG: MFS transporter [Candidatus Heimdallarchaeota archaeon]
MPNSDPQDEDNPRLVSIPEAPDYYEAVSEDDKIDLSDDELAKIPEREKIYGRSILATFSYGMVDPFLTTIAIDMGATGSQMGWLRALSNLLGNFVQPVFGFLSDKIQRRSVFVALSNILYSSIWILLLFVNKVVMIIVIASVISLVVSLGTPAWTALLGEIIPQKIRGKIIANVNWFSQFPYILSTILGGILFNYIAGELSIGSWTFQLNYFLPIAFGLVAGFASAFAIFSFKEKKARSRAQVLSKLLEKKTNRKSKIKSHEKEADSSVIESVIINGKDSQAIASDGIEAICVTTDVTKSLEISKDAETIEESFTIKVLEMFKNKDFRKFTIVFGIQSFFMSWCWPLFPIRQRSDIGANFLEIAIFSVVMSIATVITIRYAGGISDLIGRKPQMVMNRFILVAMPISYMFASQVWHIIVIHAIICIPLGLNSAVMQSYLIDVTPEKNRSLYVGFYNMFYGVILFLGSLLGGYLVDFLIGEITIGGFSPFYSQYKAVTIAFAVGFVGRLTTAFPFLTLREVKTFPYKLRDLPRLVFRSKKLLALVSTVSFFFGFWLVIMGIMGYLP